MAGVTLDNITKVYPNGAEAVSDLSLDIADGEFLVLVGPSGCGKSTALRMVAGLEDVTSGELRIGDRVVNDLPPKERDIAMVFQNYALYPHMTVGQNIGFALKLAGMKKVDIQERVRAAARTLQLEPLLDRRPAQLSGGQRQRVAMGRAIVRQPAVFLMDEPLSNLDAKLRVQMRAEIASLQSDLGTTTIYVTHDQVEAMTMGDRVAVLNDGRLQQVDKPEVLYASPDNLFVAAFIGSPAMNLLEATLDLSGPEPVVDLGAQQLTLPASVLTERAALREHDQQPVIVGIRPEGLTDVALARGGDLPGSHLRATLELRESLGPELQVHLRTDARPAVTEATRTVAATVDTAAIERLQDQAQRGEAVVVGRFEPENTTAVGQAVELIVDVTRVHLFDTDTGRAIRG